MKQHTLPIKVYLEDTDAQGIVYHANYLKFCERARTDLLQEAGYSLRSLQDEGWTFVVHEMHLKFHRPARLLDQLEVRSTAQRASQFRVRFEQKVYRALDNELLYTSEVNVVAIGDSGELREVPITIFG